MKNLKEQTKNLFVFLKETARANPKLAIASVASMIFLGSIGGIFPVIMGQATSFLQKAITIPPSITITAAITWGMAIPLLENFGSFGQSFSRMVHRLFYQKLKHKISERNLQKTIGLPTLVHQQKTEKKLSDLKEKAANCTTMIMENATRGILQLTAFCISTVALGYLYWPLAIGSIAMMGLKSGISFWSNKKLKSLQEELLNNRNIYQAKERDALANFRNIKAMGRENQIAEEMRARNKNLEELNKRFELKRKKLDILNTGLDIAFSISITIPAIYSLMQTLNLGQYFALTGCAYRSLYGGSTLLDAALQTQVQYQDYTAVMKNYEYDQNLNCKTGEKELSSVNGHIRFQDVDFKYPDTTIEKNGESISKKGQQIFNGFNLEINPGERVAIIGPSGMGKSTLVSLLSHQYEIQSGSICIDGHNVQELTSQTVYQNVHFLEQEPSFFEQENIKYNLQFFKENATEEELKKALEKAHLYDEIMNKETGLDGKTTELSPGQRQRLAIACAFLKDSPILILDEPTSKLDVDSQKAVLEAIREFGKDKTIIFVSHVPAEIATASRVLVMDQGKVIEDGPPIELMKNKEGTFRHRYIDYVRLFRSKRAAVSSKQAYQSAISAHPTETETSPKPSVLTPGAAWLSRFGNKGM